MAEQMPTIPDNLSSMAFMEFNPIVVASYLFAQEWKGKKIMFVFDNQAVVSIFRKGRSKCGCIMRLMRALTRLSLVNNFYFSSMCTESNKT